MDLKTMVHRIPLHLKLAVKDIRVSERLGYWPGRFENLMALQRWLDSDVADLFKLQIQTDVTLETLLQHVALPKASIIAELRCVINR